MAQIENDIPKRGNGHKRMNKKNTRVDLTPMVDLGFLLITFFVFTTQLSLPTAMNLNMPFDKVAPDDDVCESCVLTLYLKADNTIQFYEGMPSANTVVKQTSFATEGGIRNIILEKKKKVQQVTGQSDDFVLIIKSDNTSTFQNFVDIVDEVTINNIKHYYLDEFNEADKKLSAQKIEPANGRL